MEGGLDFVGSKDSKIIINNTHIQPAGDPDNPTYVINLSHLNMTKGSITPSSRNRVLTKEFNLKDSVLDNTPVHSEYARGNMVVSNNKFINSGFHSREFGSDPQQWNIRHEQNASIILNNNTFENYSSRVLITDHRLKNLTINDNVFNNSNGIEIYPNWSIEYGYINDPLIAEIKNNTFTKDRRGIEVKLGKFNILDNKFIESPGIKYRGVGNRLDYGKGKFYFKINNNTFLSAERSGW